MNDDEAVKKSFDSAWQMVLDGTGDKIEPAMLPRGYVLGGQPGAGKSGLIKKPHNFVSITSLSSLETILESFIQIINLFKKNMVKIHQNIQLHLQVK